MNSARPSIRLRGRGGFTLLELVIAMALIAMLVGMIFQTATANLQLSNAVVKTQNEESEKGAFFDLLSRQFAALPGNTRMELAFDDIGSHNLYSITLQNVPLNFNWGGTEKVAKAVKLAGVMRRDGFQDIVMSYYEEEILQDSDNVQNNVSVEPFAEIVLLEDVRIFEWTVLDGRTNEEGYDWDVVGRLPLQMKMVLAFGNDGPEMEQIFWIAPKQDPEVMMRQMMQNPQPQPPTQ